MRNFLTTRLNILFHNFEEYIYENKENGRFGKTPTEKGIAFGINEIEKVSEKGNVYTVLAYPPEVPGLVYKMAPMDEKMRKLNNVRKLWEAILEVTPIDRKQKIANGSMWRMKSEYTL